MRNRFLGRPSPAFVVALIALFVALGGTGYAALRLPKNSVGTVQLVNGAVTKTKIAKKTIASLHGSRGKTGPAGSTGAAGAAGATGAAGAQGPFGPQGPAGPQGPIGPQGPVGPPGNTSGVFNSDSPGLGSGVYATISAEPSSGVYSAIFGGAPGVNNGSTGVWGSSSNGWGVRGQGGEGGLAGDGGDYGVVGDGSLAGVLSNSDLAVADHIYVDGNNQVAGVCEIPSGQTSVSCPFKTSFVATTSPIVVLTPTTDPGSTYWVSDTTISGFTLNVSAAPPANLDFNFLVIGVATCKFNPDFC
jgi:Collagen triple helix repeat (20 copies)